ncbi:MAG: hypothetical protein HY998_03170 [candidate division NC10 bacterium]|nr:hypothetical protein [candidate division NC10 bacterium]
MGHKGERGRDRRGNKTLFLVIGAAAAVGLVVGLLISGLIPGSPKGRYGETGKTLASVPSAEAAEIIAKFNCPCGRCQLTLTECHCDDPRGAVEVKGFIQARLDEGKPKDEVIRLVKEKYDHYKG